MKNIAFLFLISFFAFACTKEELTPDLKDSKAPEKVTFSVETDSVSVYGGNDGKITISTTGVLPLKYKLGGKYQKSEIFDTLTAGIYTVTAIDEAGTDSLSKSVTVGQPALAPLSFTVTSTNILLYSDYTGSMTVAASGGVPPYNYQIEYSIISTPYSYTTASGGYASSSGSYNLTIADKSKISAEIPSIKWGTETTKNYTYLDARDSRDTTGNSKVTGIFTDLHANTYKITVTDKNGTVASQTKILTQAALVKLTAKLTSTNNSITVDASGGVPSYTNGVGLSYNFAIQGTDPVTGYYIGEAHTTCNKVFNNLEPGSYTIEVSDYNGDSPSVAIILSVILP